MLPRFAKFSTDELNKAFQQLGLLFSNISLDNLKHVELSGVTSSTPNASAVFRHGLKDQPSFVLIVEGDAYVARNGVGSDSVDIRSSRASQPFLALVVR